MKRALLTSTILTILFSTAAQAGEYKNVQGTGNSFNVQQVGSDSLQLTAFGNDNTAVIKQVAIAPGTGGGVASSSPDAGNAGGKIPSSGGATGGGVGHPTDNYVVLSFGNPPVPGTGLSSAPNQNNHNAAYISQVGYQNAAGYIYGDTLNSSANGLWVSQTGVNNAAVGVITGNHNSTSVTQQGANNYAGTNQVGQGNMMIASQDGANNSANIVIGNQPAPSSSAVANPSSLQALNDIASIQQVGDSNTASISEGASSKLTASNTYIKQNGDDNSAEASLNGGTRNLIGIIQRGNGNFAKEEVAGSADNAQIDQHGSYNTASITQKGSYDVAKISQSGDGNVASVTQNGSYDVATIAETGHVAHEVAITQNGNHMNQVINIKGK